MLLAGAASFGVYFVNSSLQVLMVACVFSLMLTTSNFVMAGIAVNVFPTHVAAAAVSMMICLGRTGAVASNLVFGLLLDLSCEIPIFMLASIVTCKYTTPDSKFIPGMIIRAILHVSDFVTDSEKFLLGYLGFQRCDIFECRSKQKVARHEMYLRIKTLFMRFYRRSIGTFRKHAQLPIY